MGSPGPFTVFAPTNEGFAALPEGTLDDLLKPENKGQLIGILLYHVLPGAKVLSTDLKESQTVDTMAGKPLEVFAKDGAVTVASNGVAHIIDGVMLPPSGAVVV